MDFGVQKMFSSLETIFSKPETTVDVPEIMFSAVGTGEVLKSKPSEPQRPLRPLR